MNILSSEPANRDFQLPISSFTYRDICAPVVPAVREPKPESAPAPAPPPPGIPEREVEERVNRARAEAVSATEKRLRDEYEAKSAQEADKIRKALDLFREERRDYFTRVESDVVHLAMAIAAKILHREAQVDPMMVAALVRVAVEQLHDGSSVSVRVAPDKAAKWRESLANPSNGSTIAIVEDPSLASDDCILETDLGSANFSIDAQLKEVEKGFFDLLAQRPPIK
jgi:flagellar assembly protein FliH